jgi:hypothetical protein
VETLSGNDRSSRGLIHAWYGLIIHCAALIDKIKVSIFMRNGWFSTDVEGRVGE